MKEFYNSKRRISANEINKFTYCPYQWYYERLYGMKELRRLKRERNEALGVTDQTKDYFLRGSLYHDRYYENILRKKMLLKVCLVFLLVSVIVLWFLWKKG